MEPFVFSEIYSHLNKSLENIKKSLNLPILNKKIIDLESELSNGDIWGDHLYASKLSQKLSNLKAKKDKINNLSKALQEVEDFFELANSENDSLALDSVSKTVKALEIEISDLSILTLLSGKYDNLGAIMSFRAGAGGVEACDWTQMLMRMYERFCDSNNWGFKILDYQKGDETGVKSASAEIEGQWAYGYLKAEQGTHRLVRLSPFNAQNKRQTSFAAVEVIPALEDDNEIKIDSNDLKIDVFRSSGPGGQSVNTTDSAVRVTHIPTGIVVSVQNEKSQLQNKIQAIRILEAKLLSRKLDELAKQKNDLSGDVKASWGDQIRSYTLQPYQLVKDTRTGFQTTDAQGVLNGNIAEFIKAYLSKY